MPPSSPTNWPDAVQVLKRFYEEYEHTRDVPTAIVEAMRHVGPVMIGAGLVAALSFCSLATFDLASIRTFGLLTAFGIVSALVIEPMCMVPAPETGGHWDATSAPASLDVGSGVGLQAKAKKHAENKER
mgnify:CR=1 FL=1